jgi:hypothetical protein
MRDTHTLKRYATTGLAAVAVAVAATVVSTSAALASNPTPTQLASKTGLTLSDQQLKAGAQQLINEQQIRRYFARHCRNTTGRQLAACRGVKGRHRAIQLHRSGGNITEEPYCAWNTNRPWPGYAVMATSGSALCVAKVKGTVARVPLEFDRRPLVAELRLWDHTYVNGTSVWLKWTQWVQADTQCGWVNVHIEIKLGWKYLWQKYEISQVLICGVSVFVHTPVFPPAGVYKGELRVDYGGSMPNSPHPLVDGQSESYCYYC